MSKIKSQKKEEVEKLIVENLKNAPIIEGRTVTEIAKILDLPRPTVQIYLQLLEARGLLEHFRLGRTNVFGLNKRKPETR